MNPLSAKSKFADSKRDDQYLLYGGGVRPHEKVVTSHAWFPGDTCRDDDNVASLESSLGAIIRREVTGNLSGRSDVRYVGRNLSAEDPLATAERDRMIVTQGDHICTSPCSRNGPATSPDRRLAGHVE